LDSAGHIYITGEFRDTADFDPGPGDQSILSNGVEDVFLCKFDDDGNFLWACGWGGSGSDEGEGVAVDDFGDVYVVGSFNSTVDFDPGAGSHSATSNGDEDAFVCKFDSSMNFQWAETWGGGNDEYSRAVATDGSSSIYVTGDFRSSPIDFNPDPVEVDTHNCNGSSDIYLSKFDLDGAHAWTVTWGGGGPGYGPDVSWGAAVDNSNSVYVAGHFYGTVDFDPSPAVQEEHAPDGYGSFVSKLSSAGAFEWASTWDGEDYETVGGIISIDCAGDIDVDSSGNIVVTGQCNSGTDFDPGPGVENPPFNGRTDGYLSRLNSSDGSLDWVRVFGGVYYDRGWGCVADEQANVYVAGNFSVSVDFDPGPGVDEHVSNGGSDVFLVKFLPDGSW